MHNLIRNRLKRLRHRQRPLKLPASATSISATHTRSENIDHHLHTLATRSLVISVLLYQIALDPLLQFLLQQAWRLSRDCQQLDCARASYTQIGLDESHNGTPEHGARPQRSILLIQSLLWPPTALSPTMTKGANQYHCKIYHKRPIRLLILMKDGARPGSQGGRRGHCWAVVNRSAEGSIRPMNGSAKDLHLLL